MMFEFSKRSGLTLEEIKASRRVIARLVIDNVKMEYRQYKVFYKNHYTLEEKKREELMKCIRVNIDILRKFGMMQHQAPLLSLLWELRAEHWYSPEEFAQTGLKQRTKKKNSAGEYKECLI
jgi:hypothetical protein